MQEFKNPGPDGPYYRGDPQYHHSMVRQEEAVGSAVSRADRRRRVKVAVGTAASILAALFLTAIFVLPHFRVQTVRAEERDVSGAAAAAPVETAAPAAETPSPTNTPAPTAVPTASPAPTAEPVYTQLDDWRLVLVNSEVPLPEDFEVAPRLYGGVEINSLIYEPLVRMLGAANSEGMVLWVASGYRSVEEQEAILEQAIQNRMRDYGMTEAEAEAHALRTIQPPRHSEHHTGLAVDFNDVARDFEETEAYAWLEKHAAEYGFVQRYPADKVEYTGIDYEAWHYRYVGVENARAMEELGMCLEEYCMYLKGTPIGDAGEAE